MFHGGSSLRKFSKKSKFFQFKKYPKSFPKVSKRVLNMFSGVFFENKTFAQSSMEGRVFENFQKSQKIFKNPKMPKIVPKSVQTCFEHVLGQFFRKVFIAQCSMEGRFFEIFQNQKIFKKSKNAQNRSQKCPNVF